MKGYGVFLFLISVGWGVFSHSFLPAEEGVIKIGLNYPQTGPYAAIGLDQKRGAELAIEEIHAAGGILGRRIVLVERDTKSIPEVAVANTKDLIEKEKVSMIFGGVSSSVAIAVSEFCQKAGVLFLATVTSSNDTTCRHGHRHTFRRCFNAWMGAKALAKYLNQYFRDKRYVYVVADYSWGRSAEASLRRFTDTTDTSLHPAIYTPFPHATEEDFRKAMRLVKLLKPDVVILCHFGTDFTYALQMVTGMGIKKTAAIVMPIVELSMAESAGPEAMEGIVGAADFVWEAPFHYNHPRGKKFVEDFTARYNRYPCWGAASAYTNLWEYKHAVERAKSLEAAKVIRALEGHRFTLLKEEEEWCDFDHQGVHAVYLVRCRPAAAVRASPRQMDYFEIIDRLDGPSAVWTREEWEKERRAAGLPPSYEPLEDEEHRTESPTP